MSFTNVLEISDEQILDACRVMKLVGEKAKEASTNQLLEEDNIISVEIDYTSTGQRKNTPVKIVLKKSLFNPVDGDTALLIVSDKSEKVKDELKESPVEGVTKVVTLDKVRKTFARYEQRRDLVKSFSRILADEAIVPMIPSVLGNASMKSRKLPVPVKLGDDAEKRKGSIAAALSSTLLQVNWSCVTSVKVGKLSFTEKELLENIRCVLPVVFKYIDAERIAKMCLMVGAIPLRDV